MYMTVIIYTMRAIIQSSQRAHIIYIRTIIEFCYKPYPPQYQTCICM